MGTLASSPEEKMKLLILAMLLTVVSLCLVDATHGRRKLVKRSAWTPRQFGSQSITIVQSQVNPQPVFQRCPVYQIFRTKKFQSPFGEKVHGDDESEKEKP